LKEIFSKDDLTILDYYPNDFWVDLEQKEAAWKGEVLLPFFKIERIREILMANYDRLTEEEKERDMINPVLVYRRAG
jgi:5'-3' exoribonuclease 2